MSDVNYDIVLQDAHARVVGGQRVDELHNPHFSAIVHCKKKFPENRRPPYILYSQKDRSNLSIKGRPSGILEGRPYIERFDLSFNF